MRLLSVVVIAAGTLGALVTACGTRDASLGPTRTPKSRTPVGVTLTPVPWRDTIALAQGKTLTLRADAVDAVGVIVPGVTFRFRIEDDRVATFSQIDANTAVVTPRGPAGLTLVSALSDSSSGGLITAAILAVTQVPARLVVMPSSVRLLAGGARQLRGAVLDLVGDTIADQPIAFTVTGSALANVTPSGVVHSIGPLGSSALTVRSGSFTASVPIDVVIAGHPAGRIAATIRVKDPFVTAASVTNEGVAFVTQLYTGKIHRVDLATGAVHSFAAHPRYDDLRGIALTADAGESFVAASCQCPTPLNDVLHLNTRGQAIQAYTTGRVWHAPVSVALSHDEQTVYVGTGNGFVYAAEVATERRLFESGVGSIIVALVLHPTRPILYASGERGGVSEIDVATGEFRVIDVGGNANDRIATQGIALSPNGGELYIVRNHGLGGMLLIWDTERRVLVDSIALPTEALGLVATPDGAQLYVGSEFLYPGEIWIIDPGRRAIVQTLAMGGVVQYLAISPDGATIVAPNSSGWVDFIR